MEAFALSEDVTAMVQARLFALQDEKYKRFQASLMPTVDRETVIGVRIPMLRNLALSFAGTEQAQIFLQSLPHRYYEENNLHAFLIEKIGDFEKTIEALDVFLPHVNNWATCDMMSPRCLADHRAQLLPFICTWLNSPHPYAVRYAIGLLMKLYLGTAFSPIYPEMVAAIKRDEYYIRMMIAWYFATALALQYDAVIPFLEEERLDAWVHNKAIQKSLESRRLSAEKKAYLKSLKLKKTR